MDWAESAGIRIEFIQPGRPQQSTYIERFNRTDRHLVKVGVALNRKGGCRFTSVLEPPPIDPGLALRIVDAVTGDRPRSSGQSFLT
jgi:transposase InsO family protein